ncbi:hypothetical protein HQ590_15155, partial [bacterium]|nr:hypothetical protein [bacterium]
MSEPSPHPDPVAALRDQFAAAGDGLLLQDRQRLAGRLRQLEHRRRARQPVDRLSEALARDLEQARIRWQARQGWQPVFEFPAPLPVSLHCDRIREALQRHQVIIVCGDTGSGKTTQLPKIALQAGRGRLGRIGVTQPRRLAAVSMARRVADELHVDLGRQVGYQVRFSNAFGDETAVKFMTDGILLAETRQDRRLWQYDTIVLDEAHERSLNIDFLLGYLKNLLPQRPDLKLIISSATIDPESFAQFFDNAPVLMVEGRSHPIEDLWFPSLGPDEEIVRHVARAVRWVDELDPEGDILVFLPGEREIRDAAELLRGWLETHGARRGGGHDSPPHPSASPPNDGRRHGRPLPRRGEAFRSPLPSGGEGQGEGAGGGG